MEYTDGTVYGTITDLIDRTTHGNYQRKGVQYQQETVKTETTVHAVNRDRTCTGIVPRKPPC